MAVVAVVGLGAMGARIARRLLETGHELVVWNRDPGKATPLIDLGAAAVPNPADAARAAEAVLIMVADPAALQDVTEGQDGIAGGASARTTVVQMSTVVPASVDRLASVLPEGTDLLDAPVLGSLSEVESGTLKVFAGGPSELVERWTLLLSDLGSVLHVGPLGAGTAAKLVANSTLLGTLGVLGEALALGQALGLPEDTTFEVLAATPLAAQAGRRRPAVESGEYEPARFTVSLARKDAELISGAAAAAGIELRLAPAVREWFAEADKAGRSEQDYSAVLAQMLERR